MAGAATALREARSYSFEFDTTRVRADRPEDEEVLVEGEGAVDLDAREGRVEVDFSRLFAGLPAGAGDDVPTQVELRWDARTIHGHSGGRVGRLPRAEAAGSDGLVGRIPDEVEGLVRLLEHGTGARRGASSDTVEFAVPIEKAAAAGTPAEFARSAARRLVGPRLEMSTTVDDDGRPTRISYTYRLKPARESETGREVLPARTVTVEYRLGDFGDDVDVGPPGRND